MYFISFCDNVSSFYIVSKLYCSFIFGFYGFPYNFDALDNPNLSCIEVDDVNYSTTNWTNIDSWANFSTDCGNSGCSLSISGLNNTLKQLIKIVDVLGRETPFKPNTPLLYIYNDGTVERKMIIEQL